jgi:CRP-like cAMP-binding protein
MEHPPVNLTGHNRLLDVLGGMGRNLASSMQLVHANRGHALAARGEPFTHVHFPLDGMVSMVLGTESGISVEVATVGNEGMVGTEVFLGGLTSRADVFFETSGSYLRLDAPAFQSAVRLHPALGRLAGLYTQVIMTQMAQSVLCATLHTLEERLCRWLLMTHDRMAGDELDLTQEFLAQMLGVRRPSVTVVAGILQRAGLIRYNRGRVTVLDRQGLEDSACECYALVRREMDRLLSSTLSDT